MLIHKGPKIAAGLALSALLFLGSSLTYGQSPSATSTAASSSQSTVPVIRTTSRLVVVDVVVSDSQGQPVKNLKPSEFTLLENGKPQKVSFFEAHSAASNRVAIPPTPAIQLPQHEYTNFTPPNGTTGISIILLDMLNTSREDQVYGRQQMLLFLKKLPTHQPVALFTLGDNLRMLQGFTSSSDALVAAAQSLLTEHSRFLRTESEIQQQEELTQYEGGASSPSPSSLVALIRNALGTEDEVASEIRARTTLNALRAIGQILAGYPGRKNLIWLSGGFPVRFGPDGQRDPVNTFPNYASDIRETAKSLEASQVSVYPIDVRGITTRGLGDVGANTIGSLNSTQIRTGNDEWYTHSAMRDIAEQTGGKAFYGSNDLENAISRSFLHAANYYSLAYAPDNRNWNGQYRKIGIKLAVKGMHLDYRRGYYAVVDHSTQPDQASRLLFAAMFPALPEYTMLLLKVRILPPDPEHPNVRIDYAVAPDDLTFASAPGNKKRVSVDFAVMAWDKNGHQVAQVGDAFEGTFDSDALAGIHLSGLPEHQEIKLPPGTYRVRLGAIDLESQKIGTLDVLLTVPTD